MVDLNYFRLLCLRRRRGPERWGARLTGFSRRNLVQNSRRSRFRLWVLAVYLR